LISSRRAASFFKKFINRSPGQRMVARMDRTFAINHGAKTPVQGLLGDNDAERLEDSLRENRSAASAPMP
jgi:hypothetical protein